MNVFFDASYCATDVAWETTRKALAVAASLEASPIPDVVVRAPQPATIAELRETLGEEYLDALVTGTPWHLAQSNAIGWDERLLSAVCASNGGVRDAALHALRSSTNAGSLSSGLHHARAERGNGYCTVNGLVIAARAAVGDGAQRVLVLDLDAHCGGGTASYLESMPHVEQLDVSVHTFDSYHGMDASSLVLTDGRRYLDDVERSLAGLRAAGSIDLILYNAGMDPHVRAGGVRGIDGATMAAREQMVFRWAQAAGVPVAWVLAGGYTIGMGMDELVDLHRLTIAAALVP